jgi:hypothetical protein
MMAIFIPLSNSIRVTVGVTNMTSMGETGNAVK